MSGPDRRTEKQMVLAGELYRTSNPELQAVSGQRQRERLYSSLSGVTGSSRMRLPVAW